MTFTMVILSPNTFHVRIGSTREGLSEGPKELLVEGPPWCVSAMTP